MDFDVGGSAGRAAAERKNNDRQTGDERGGENVDGVMKKEKVTLVFQIYSRSAAV